MNLELKGLDDLIALAGTRSFGKAAEKRCGTQPADSRHIR
ncbi:LysR substrate-binding domain-containing protein, partial [Pseudomonas aeruginosa]